MFKNFKKINMFVSLAIFLVFSSCNSNFNIPSLTTNPPTTIIPTPTRTRTIKPTPSYTNTPVPPTSVPSYISPEFPNTTESKEIISFIEYAYDIETYAAFTFDLTIFPSLFINDSRFEVRPSTLNTIRELTGNLTLETAGYLEYKMAYYSWRRDSILHEEPIYATAESENRDLSDEEITSLLDEYIRSVSHLSANQYRTHPISFISLLIFDDIAKVVIDIGFAKKELTLVYVNNQWFIAAAKNLSINP